MLDLTEVHPDRNLAGVSQALLFRTPLRGAVRQTYYMVERMIRTEKEMLVRLSLHGQMKAVADLTGHTSTEIDDA